MYTEFHKSHITQCKNQTSFHVPMNLHKILAYKDINMNNIKLLSLLKLLQLLTGLFHFLKDGHYPLLGIKATFGIVFLQEFMFLQDKNKIRTIIRQHLSWQNILHLVCLQQPGGDCTQASLLTPSKKLKFMDERINNAVWLFNHFWGVNARNSHCHKLIAWHLRLNNTNYCTFVQVIA